MFNFEWSRFDAKIGLIFMIGVTVVSALGSKLDFDVTVAGISALIGWIPIILAPGASRHRHLAGLAVYLVAGSLLAYLAYIVEPHTTLKLVSLTLVTFTAYLVLMRGIHSFLVAWCLAYWYLLAPLFLGDDGLEPLLVGHLVGAGLVIALNLLKPIWAQATGAANTETAAAEQVSEEQPGLGYVMSFATIVSVSIAGGAAVGLRWLTADPTVIANATLNMISPSLQQTWVAAVERLVLGTAGLLGGFYLGWYFPEPWMGIAVTTVCSFLALGVLYINFALMVGILFFITAYSWGTMQSGLAHQIGNEKLIGELIGVVIAVMAIAVLTHIRTRRGAVTPE